MYKSNKILGIITARGGSKGLPHKNIKELCGKPLIAWSIEQGLKSKYVDEVMVTTDDQQIADISQEYGAQVPFIRPAKLASDTATSFDAIKHAIDYYNQSENKYDYIVLLEPTSPLRETTDIDTAIEILINNEKGAESIVGISENEAGHPSYSVVKDNDKFIKGYESEEMKVLRRQELSNIYFFEGSLYISEVDSYLKQKTFYHQKTLGYEVPKWKSLEIDDIYDFVMVEAVMNYRNKYLKES